MLWLKKLKEVFKLKLFREMLPISKQWNIISTSHQSEHVISFQNYKFKTVVWKKMQEKKQSKTPPQQTLIHHKCSGKSSFLLFWFQQFPSLCWAIPVMVVLMYSFWTQLFSFLVHSGWHDWPWSTPSLFFLAAVLAVFSEFKCCFKLYLEKKGLCLEHITILKVSKQTLL